MASRRPAEDKTRMAGNLQLYLFDSGTIGLAGLQVPVPFFLIRHPEGSVLIDGGNPIEVARDTRAYWGPLADKWDVHMSEEQHCAAQLKQLGMEPDSVRYVVQTHLHIDHTGALGHFPNATVLVHARELQAARAADPPVASGYLPRDYASRDIPWKLVNGELDLYRDGVVRLLETPGHSPGHMSALLQLDGTGPVLLTGDAVDNAAQWERRAPLRALSSRDQATRSLQRLRGVARETGAMIIFGHDPKNWAKRRHAPERYS
jgi:N-acyl homoserine lactone hydrolase